MSIPSSEPDVVVSEAHARWRSRLSRAGYGVCVLLVLALLAGFLHWSRPWVWVLACCWSLLGLVWFDAVFVSTLFLLPLLPRNPAIGTANYALGEVLVLCLALAWLSSTIWRQRGGPAGRGASEGNIAMPGLLRMLLVFFALSVLATLPALVTFPPGYAMVKQGPFGIGSFLYPLKELVNTFEGILLALLLWTWMRPTDGRRQESRRKRALFALFCAFTVMAAWGLLQGLRLLPVNAAFAGRALGPFNHPNILAGALILLLPLTLLLQTRVQRVSLLSLGLAALFSTASRGAGVALFLAMLLYRRRLGISVKHLALLLLFSVLLLGARANMVHDLELRMGIYRAALVAIPAHPSGVGAGTLYLRHLLPETILHAHNIVLQYALERGWLAALAFLLAVLLVYRTDKSRPDKTGACIMTGVSALFLYGLWDYLFFSQRLYLLFIAMLIVAYIRMANPARPSARDDEQRVSAQHVQVLIPAYNEEQCIGATVRAWQAVGDVIVADSGSSDGTAAVARDAGARVVACGRGKGRAVRKVLQEAGAVNILVDADGAFSPEDGEMMLAQLRGGAADMVIGRREDRDAHNSDNVVVRRLGAKWYQCLYHWRTGRDDDFLCGLRAFNHKVAALPLVSTGFGIDTEMALFAHEAGLRVLSQPVTLRARSAGEQKSNVWNVGPVALWHLLFS